MQQLRVWLEEHWFVGVVRATMLSAGRADAMTARETKAAMLLNCILVGFGLGKTEVFKELGLGIGLKW